MSQAAVRLPAARRRCRPPLFVHPVYYLLACVVFTAVCTVTRQQHRAARNTGGAGGLLARLAEHRMNTSCSRIPNFTSFRHGEALHTVQPCGRKLTCDKSEARLGRHAKRATGATKQWKLGSYCVPEGHQDALVRSPEDEEAQQGGKDGGPRGLHRSRLQQSPAPAPSHP